MVYQTKLDKFEGPLDLLLELIEGQKLDIAEVSLAKVADQFLEYISQREKITLESLADFLTVASKLILIKSKTLLPTLEFSEEEEKEIVDLEKQLIEFKKFKDISIQIGKMSDSKRMSFSREKFVAIKTFFYPPENIHPVRKYASDKELNLTEAISGNDNVEGEKNIFSNGVNIFDLKKYFVKVLSEIPAFEKLEEEMVREVITLEERIGHLHDFIKGKVETSFSELVSTAEDKIDVIISFLAMLEMVKQRIINVEQNNLFESIKMKIKN